MSLLGCFHDLLLRSAYLVYASNPSVDFSQRRAAKPADKSSKGLRHIASVVMATMTNDRGVRFGCQSGPVLAWAVKVSGKPPPIAITRDTYDRLWSLALAALDRAPMAELLLDELSRAQLVRCNETRSAGLGLDEAVDFALDDEVRRQCRLVYPPHADPAEGRISVLSSVGVMLVGLAENQSISWTDQNGLHHLLTVLKRHGPLRP